MEYYCPKCDKFVEARDGAFNHPDLGIRPCLVCPKCNHMVYKKEDGNVKV